MKRISALLLVSVCFFGLFSCGEGESEQADGVALTDVFGNTVRLTADARVVGCYGSFAECWLLAGG